MAEAKARAAAEKVPAPVEEAEKVEESSREPLAGDPGEQVTYPKAMTVSEEIASRGAGEEVPFGHGGVFQSIGGGKRVRA